MLLINWDHMTSMWKSSYDSRMPLLCSRSALWLMPSQCRFSVVPGHQGPLKCGSVAALIHSAMAEEINSAINRKRLQCKSFLKQQQQNATHSTNYMPLKWQSIGRVFVSWTDWPRASGHWSCTRNLGQRRPPLHFYMNKTCSHNYHFSS